MSNLVDFSKRIEEQLAGTNREPHWEAGEAERYMADVGTAATSHRSEQLH